MVEGGPMAVLESVVVPKNSGKAFVVEKGQSLRDVLKAKGRKFP
jgi:hypothetical protein